MSRHKTEIYEILYDKIVQLYVLRQKKTSLQRNFYRVSILKEFLP